MQTERFEFETSNLVWVSCPYPAAVALELERVLKPKARIYDGQEPPVDEAPSSIIFYPYEEDIASEVRRFRTLAPDASILVLSLGIDPELARAALLAGAHGFIHLGMQPAHIARAISAAPKDETVIPRELLEAFLVEVESWGDLIPTSRQRKILEQILAVVVSSGDEVAIPRELLEAFLMEVAMA
jgi:DNA-binding NarL/FixJ family response regulator